VEDLKPIAYPLLILGLVLIVLSRGCDNISVAGTAVDRAKLRIAQSNFEYDTQSKLLPLQQQLQDVQRDTKLEAEARDKKLKEINDKLDKAQKQARTDKKELEAGKWRKLEYKSGTARNRSARGFYWRQWIFLFGSIALVVGLAVISGAGVGSERWAAMTLLGIVLVSIYLGGLAWMGAIAQMGSLF